MQEIEIYISEIKVALRKCKEEEYSEKAVKRALELLGELCPLLTDKSAQDTILLEMQNLANKAKAAAEKRKEFLPSDGSEKDGADIHAVFPLLENSLLEGETLCNFSVIETQKGCRDNAFLLYGPFEEELLYQAKCYAKAKGLALRLVDLSLLTDAYSQQASELLNGLSAYAENAVNECILYCNLSALKANENVEQAVCYYLKRMRLKAPNTVQLLLSSDPEYAFEKVYKKWVESFYPDEDMLDKLYYGSLNFVFIALPNYAFTRAQVYRALNLSTEETESEKWDKLLKKEGILLGYEGLRTLLKTSSKETWQKDLQALTAGRRERLEFFYKSVGENFACIADEDWGYKLPKKKKAEKAEVFEQPLFVMPRTVYDGIVGIEEIRENIEKILNKEGVSVLMKCPWALAYALDNGDTLNLLNLDKEGIKNRMRERWELAYDALSLLMKIPRGELVFDLNNSGDTDGLCCDGGRTLRFKKLFLESNDSTVLERGKKAFLHEAYHALQHTAVNALKSGDRETLAYYLVHFGINSHAEEWRENFSRYREPKGEEGYEEYYDQVVEAEARIFANDRLREFANFDPPKLD